MPWEQHGQSVLLHNISTDATMDNFVDCVLQMQNSKIFVMMEDYGAMFAPLLLMLVGAAGGAVCSMFVPSSISAPKILT